MANDSRSKAFLAPQTHWDCLRRWVIHDKDLRQVWKLHQPPNQRWKMFGICVSLHQATSFLGWVWWGVLVTGKCSSSLLCISFGNLWLITKSPYLWCQRSHSGIIMITNYYILLPLVVLVPVLLLSFMDRILLQLRYMEHCWTSSYTFWIKQQSLCWSKMSTFYHQE